MLFLRHADTYDSFGLQDPIPSQEGITFYFSFLWCKPRPFAAFCYSGSATRLCTTLRRWRVCVPRCQGVIRQHMQCYQKSTHYSQSITENYFCPAPLAFHLGMDKSHLGHISAPFPGRLRVTGREPIPAPPPCRGHSLFLGYTLPSLQTCSNWSWPELPSVALRFFLGPELADLMATTCSGRHTCGPSHT